MGIQDIVERHYSEFISLVDLIDATAEATGLHFDVVSQAFWRTRLLDKVKHWKRCVRSGDLTESDGEPNRDELAQYVCAPPFKTLSDADCSELRNFSHGFRTSEIKAAMIDCGLETPPCLDEGAAPFRWIDPRFKPFYNRIAALEAEVERLQGELEAQKDKSGHSSAPLSSIPPWPHNHDTRLFKLLPVVIAAAKSEPSWPKQEVLIAQLVEKHGLTQADAKALDAVTRPDERRRK